MAFTLPDVSTLEQSTTIKFVPGFDAIIPTDPSTHVNVGFRQATAREDMLRDSWANEDPSVFEYKRGDSNGSMRQQVRMKPERERRAYDVFLTMSSCDIQMAEGKLLFRFSEMDGQKRVPGSFEDFKTKWGKLPTSLALAIHLQCLKVNQDWISDYTSRAEEDDDSSGE